MAVRNTTTNRGLNGLNPLSYMGDNPTTPPDFYSIDRDPGVNDWQDFMLCDLWLNTSARTAWILVSLSNNQATWVQFAGGSGDLNRLTASDGTIATSVAGNITFPDAAIAPNIDSNIQSTAVAGSFTINLKPTINLPNTNAAGTQGVIYLAGSRFINNYLNNTAVGINAGNLTATVGVGIFNSAFGNDSLKAITTGAQNSGFGHAALDNVTTGSNNVALGYVSGGGITTGSNNCFIGDAAGLAYAGAESNNIIIGAGISGTLGESNVIRIGNGATDVFISNAYSSYGTGNAFVGTNSGNFTLTVGSAITNTGLGDGTLNALTTGQSNTCAGYFAGVAITTSSGNTLMGYTSGQTLTTGSGQNSAYGYQSMVLATTAASNTAIGYNSLGQLLTGTNNIALGINSGSSFTGAESSNITIGNTGTAADANTIRLGTSGGGAAQQNKCFIAGIRGITTGVNDAIAVLIDSAGQLGTVSSSSRFKENIEDLGSDSDSIMKMRPVKFNYKNHSPDAKCVGLIAEEVKELMPGLVVDNEYGEPLTIKYHELPVLLLNEIQKLNKRISELEKKNG